MKPAFPYKITYQKFRDMVYIVGGTSFEPTVYYPTIDDIKSHMYSSDPTPERKPEDDIKFFIWSLIYGFSKDEAWHKENPGCHEKSISNLIKYIFRPVMHNGGELHTNIWGVDDEEDTMCDKEACFDYIQDILTDIGTLEFEFDESITDDLYYEILIRQKYRDDIKDISISDGKIEIEFKKSCNRDNVTAESFNTLYYYINM